MFPPFDPASISILMLNFVKILFYIGFAFYIVFAFIALRQIQIMRKTVITPFSTAVLIIGIAHLFMAIGALLFAIVVLM